jgi:hypothetical protein
MRRLPSCATPAEWRQNPLALVGHAGIIAPRIDSGEARPNMPFVKRNASGAIVVIHASSNADATEELSPDSPELVAFMARRPDDEEIKAGLVLSDAELIRVIEDLIEVLVRKQLILPTDLPSPALDKITHRRKLRDQLTELVNLVGGERDEIF